MSRSLRSVARVRGERQDPRSAESVKPALPTRTVAEQARRTHPVQTPRATNSARNGTTPQRHVRRDISTAGPHESVTEELTAVAHDPHWIHARWVLKRTTVLRAEAALGAQWFRSVPVIRVFALDVDEVKGVSANWVRDVEIHGECDHWFVPVENPPGAYKLEIGYAVPRGPFFALAKSRKVTTPRPGSKAAERLGWNRGNGNGAPARTGLSRSPVTDPQFEKFLAARAVSYALGNGNVRAGGSQESSFAFSLDAELIVSGTAGPQCQLTLQGETVKVGRDGRFTAKLPLLDGRQVIPATAIGPNGTEQRTIVLAVDRNTKELPLQSLEELN